MNAITPLVTPAGPAPDETNPPPDFAALTTLPMRSLFGLTGAQWLYPVLCTRRIYRRCCTSRIHAIPRAGPMISPR